MMITWRIEPPYRFLFTDELTVPYAFIGGGVWYWLPEGTKMFHTLVSTDTIRRTYEAFGLKYTEGEIAAVFKALDIAQMEAGLYLAIFAARNKATGEAIPERAKRGF